MRERRRRLEELVALAEKNKDRKFLFDYLVKYAIVKWKVHTITAKEYATVVLKFLRAPAGR